MEAFDPKKIRGRWAPDVAALQTEIDKPLGDVSGANTIEHERYSEAATPDHGPIIEELLPRVVDQVRG